MQYLILITSPETDMSSVPESAQREMMKEWFDYTEAMKKAGVMKHGDALQPTTTATRISKKDGKRVVLDGPFTEAKEVIGGYYQIETKTREEALAWAEKCPGVRYGTVELRPVVVFG